MSSVNHLAQSLPNYRLQVNSMLANPTPSCLIPLPVKNAFTIKNYFPGAMSLNNC